jgi:teichuronic acid biosynthesis glycosyltransferase TuaC
MSSVAAPRLRLLTFSSLFPSATRPNFGVFVENRLRHLVASGEVASTVLAPVPFFPSANPRFGDHARMAATPRREVRHGLEVHHPRFPVIPRVGMSVAPWLLYRASLRAVRRMMRDGLQFDAIDAHYLYPDGVAAVWLGRALGRPVVITARGSDVTELPNYRVPRALIQRAIRDADALISVSAGLKAALVALGAPDGKVTVLRNGVEIDVFRPPADRAAARAALGLTRPTLISVGGLIPRKGHDRSIAAMALLPGYELLILGEGPEHGRLAAQIAALGLADRVRLLGPRPHAELPAYYGAADAMVLASSREGWANVLLESMACGTPVVASNIPGNPEVVQTRDAGVITRVNTAEGIAEAVRALFAELPDRRATRAYAEPFGWDETSAGQEALFTRVVAEHRNLKD